MKPSCNGRCGEASYFTIQSSLFLGSLEQREKGHAFIIDAGMYSSNTRLPEEALKSLTNIMHIG